MLVVVDIGNTRTKWATVDNDGQLGDMQMTPNATMLQSKLKNRLADVEKVVIANVAGDVIAQQLLELIPGHAEVVFAKASAEAAGVKSYYQPSTSLGIDRWAAIVAAWHRVQQPVVVVNAGTAVTIDSISVDTAFKFKMLQRSASKGHYLGGTIMPGLYTMQDALASNTAQLPAETTGTIQTFPVNTVDAMYTGCMHAVIGSVLLALKQLEKHSAFLPRLIITGGDAGKMASGLQNHIKKIMVEDDLVLQGSVLLEKEQV